MNELSINSRYMRRLIEKMRAVMGREAEVMPDPGGNPSDDAVPAALQEGAGDLSREELREEIMGLDDDHQCELVALMWIGRGDYSAEDWPEALAMAAERHTGPTAEYLLAHPMVADELAAGLEELGYSHVMQDGDY